MSTLNYMPDATVVQAIAPGTYPRVQATLGTTGQARTELKS